MAILMMVMLVGLMLSALLVPMMITQDRTTRSDSTRVQALDAAQSGVDVALGGIRASITNGIGNSRTLPCGTETGGTATTGAAVYSVVIEYFTADPTHEVYPSANAMKCVAGYGTFDGSSGSTTPAFARFTSTGTVGSASGGTPVVRTVTSTYLFRTSKWDILGGTIQISPASSALCMDVASATPPAFTPVAVRACSTTSPLLAQQVFSYRTDLTLQLVGSTTPSNANGLCLNSAHTPAVLADPVQLSQCAPLGLPATYTQQWSYNTNGQYEVADQNTAATGLFAAPLLCMTVSAPATAGQQIKLGDCGSASGWIPSTSVGIGNAGLTQSAGGAVQWINFGDVGRCLDVPNEQTSATFLIDYPCKSNPYPGAAGWNELFQPPANPNGAPSVTGTLLTNTNGANYCLTSPGTNGSFPTVAVCGSVGGQTWTVNGGDKSLNYSTKYTLVNGGLCLGLSAPNPNYPAWFTIDVETCTGATSQKWNATATNLLQTLTNTHEN